MELSQLDTSRKTSSTDQAWWWWPLLPLYPYGRRRTFVRELVPDRLWTLEQMHGVWYVAVPIRMTVLKVGKELMLYSPIAATPEVVAVLHALEERHGPIRTIVLATSSGLEHKVPLPALARAFPDATVWISKHQWSFPLQLPASWLGFPMGRTRVLVEDGLPHADQLAWIPLGPLDLGLGTFLDVACLDRETGALLVTDSLVSMPSTPPALFDIDPTPLLFHAREKGSEPLVDTPSNREKGWKRIVLFANYFRPNCISVPSLPPLLTDMFARDCRDARSHFGFYPFRWSEDWEQEADSLFCGGRQQSPVRLAPVLERLVFPRAQQCFLAWLKRLGEHPEIKLLVSAHYHAPQPLSAEELVTFAHQLQQQEWAPSAGPWQTLASIDSTLMKFGLVKTNE
ncbi:MAG: DUF4336 domain-containing protein [Cyanobacteriota bacterium]|jgi:hypothetical protein